MHCKTNISSSSNWVVLELALSGRFHLVRGDLRTQARLRGEYFSSITLCVKEIFADQQKKV